MDEEQGFLFTEHKRENVFNIDADLRDDSFLELVEDFLGSQSGEKLRIDKRTCKNRFLIQVGLLKEENQVSWGNVVKWLQKIFPMYWSSDFRSLIERSLDTALSLSRDARERFLQSDVNFEFVGPICDSLGIGRSDLLEMSDFSEQAKCIEVTNGLVLELKNLIKREKIDPIILVSWLRNLSPQFCSDGKIDKANKFLQTKLKKFKMNYRTHQKRKNSMMEKFLQTEFELFPSTVKSKVRRLCSVNRTKNKLFLSKFNSQEEMVKLCIGKNGALTALPKQMPGNSLSNQGDGRSLLFKNIHEKSKMGTCEYTMKPEPAPILCPFQIISLVNTKRQSVPSTNECNQTKGQVVKGTIVSPDAMKAEVLTLLDVSVLFHQKLSSVYGSRTEESKQVSKDLLEKHFTLMLEEDAVFREFSEKIGRFQKGPGSVISPLLFLDCNANFLLEVSNAVEHQVMDFEKEIVSATGEKLGRDKNPKFSNFVNFSESAASRYIRMVSDVLSPPGETKHGCRRRWLDFCHARNKPSKLAVSLSNRFNNYFEGAASVIHHHADIVHFFSDLKSSHFDKLSVIQESVTYDADDQFIQALVCVIAIVYCKILGPYWQLLKSSEKYGRFHRSVQCLHQKLIKWSEDASPLLLPECSENIFHQFPLQERSFTGVFSYCRRNSKNHITALIRKCLEITIKTIATIAETSLMDFLPGGLYSKDPSIDLSLELSDCQLSHLMVEYPYGHVYSNKCKRPDHLTGLLTSSFTEESKDASDFPRENVVLDNSSTNCSQIQESGLMKKFQIPGVNLDDVNMDTHCQNLTSNNSILAAVTKKGGPCTSKEDVDHQLE